MLQHNDHDLSREMNHDLIGDDFSLLAALLAALLAVLLPAFLAVILLLLAGF